MHSASYINKVEGSGSAWKISTSHLFAFVQSPAGERGIRSYERLHERLKDDPPFDPETAGEVLSRYPDLSVALLTHQDQTLTLATAGSGVVFLQRAGKILQLVGQGSGAHGPPERGDVYILTTVEFVQMLGGAEGMGYYFLHYTISEVEELMKTYEDPVSTCGFVAVQYGSSTIQSKTIVLPETNDHIVSDATATEQSGRARATDPLTPRESSAGSPHGGSGYNRIYLPVRSVIARIRSTLSRIHRGLRLPRVRLLSLIIIPTALLIFLALQGVRSTREGSAGSSNTLETVTERIEKILADVDTEAFVNISGVGATIQSARTLIDDLPASTRERYRDNLSALRERIDDKEREVMRVATSPVEEYYDFKLISSGAQATDIDSNGVSFAILDAQEGAIYLIGNDVRSHEILRSDKYKGATQITLTDRFIYVLTAGDGIYLAEADRSTQVVKKDPAWGNISDMKAYTGNIYLLDSKRRSIVKYAGVDEESFGDEMPYLVPEVQGNLTTTDRFAIDGAIYTIGADKAEKFVTGRRADFNFLPPHKDVGLRAVYTSPDTDYLYYFDDQHRALYVMDKSGVFERQWLINHPVISVSASEDGAWVFAVTADHIYRMSNEGVPPTRTP